MWIEEENEKFIDLKKKIRTLCHQCQIKPLRRRGQNFLINQKILAKFLEAAELKKDDLVLEIGAGFGTLTEEIVKQVKKVVAVEIDKKLVEVLKEQLMGYKNVEIIQANILDPEIDSYIRLSALSSTLRLGLEESSRPKGKRFALGPSPTDRSSIESDSWVIDLGSMDRNGSRIIRSRYKIIANLPYNITGAVLRKFLHSGARTDVDSSQTDTDGTRTNADNILRQSASSQRQSAFWPRLKLMVLMLQKEVGERICAKPPRMSLLSVFVQFYSQPKIISRVSKECFWPKPKVESVILKILINKQRPPVNEGDFFSLVRAGFQQPRKYLLNNLVHSVRNLSNGAKSAITKKSREELKQILEELNHNPKIRPGELSVEDWINLYKKLIEM